MKLQRPSLLEIILGMVLLICLTSFLQPFLFPSPHKVTPPPCQKNLEKIGRAMTLYRIRHEARLKRLQDLVPEYLDNPRCFVCPFSQHEPGNMTNVDDWTDFTLLRKPLVAPPGEMWPGDTIHVLCLAHPHRDVALLGHDRSPDYTVQFLNVWDDPGMGVAISNALEATERGFQQTPRTYSSKAANGLTGNPQE